MPTPPSPSWVKHCNMQKSRNRTGSCFLHTERKCIRWLHGHRWINELVFSEFTRKVRTISHMTYFDRFQQPDTCVSIVDKVVETVYPQEKYSPGASDDTCGKFCDVFTIFRHLVTNCNILFSYVFTFCKLLERFSSILPFSAGLEAYGVFRISETNSAGGLYRFSTGVWAFPTGRNTC